MSKIDFFQYVIEFDEIDSTNLYLKNNYQTLPNYTIIKTKYQTLGQGQFGRVWESNYNENLLFSLLIKKDLPFVVKDANPIFVSAILAMLDEFGIEASFKYPNDIQVGGKKLAGILIETKFSGPNVDYVIVGIGLNVNQTEFNAPNAVSLKNILGKDFDIDYVFKKLLKHLSNSVLLANLMYLVRMNEER
ncbi:MAG TPA: biotin--[acetyl-CoA-carboxylase] ligase [Acholeplasmataceae bacterium]|jgi:biotin-[acetyl-CoA-carboxylase] ligase BirA-like protein|nr:biotin--[acetyl-CoA-carboxylase] ligase [Acholeplasmataceae bacterium]